MKSGSSKPPNEGGVVLCVASMAFAFQFESALVTVSLPDMARELSVSPNAISLVVLSYLAGAVAFFMPAGKLGDRHGLRPICLGGCLLAGLGTILCSTAHSISALVIARLIQGVGAGGFVAVGYAMIPTWVSQARVGWGYGMQSLGAGVGMVAGVPVGGLLSSYLTWPWIFVSSIPLFAALLVLAFCVLPDAKHQTLARNDGIQWGILALFTVVTVGVSLTLGGGSMFGWSSLPVIASVTCFLAAIIGLWIADRNGHHLFSPGLLSSRTAAPALITMFLMAAVTGGVRFALPFHMELGCGLSILMSSYLLLTYPILYAPVSLMAGRLSDWLGSSRVILTATVMTTLSTAVFVIALPHTNAAGAAAFMMAFGAATGLFFAPANRLIMSSIPMELRGEAGAALSIIFNFGTLMGIALFQLVLTVPPSGREMLGNTELLHGGIAFGHCLTLASGLGALAVAGALRIGREP